MKLKGQIALITGAASGIGKRIALTFAGEGASLALADINEKGAFAVVDEIRITGGQACAVCGDVSCKEDVTRMVLEANRSLGPIEILVNCAGISEIRPFLEITEAQWDLTIRVNLKSVFLTCQAVLPGMRKRKQGSIINLSSQSGKRGASWYADYCASKFGIIGLTQSLALEFAREGVRINAICPGIIQTGLWDDAMWSGYARKSNLDPRKVKEAVIGKIPMGRLGTTEDVAGVALFLASDDSSYLTGQAINVNGGALMS
jgi:NAD(P)-dependent dehydrogenase (short-subunit alcohol dehydrogenase family)